MTIRVKTRNKGSRVAVVALTSLLALSACTGQGDKETFGTLLGAGLGAWLGSEIGGHGSGQVVGAAIGTMVGASIGNDIGKSLDRADRMALTEARYVALESTPSGRSSNWYNPDSGNSGEFVPSPAYREPDGRHCREYTQTITIGGQTEEGYGTACRMPDGSWQIVNG